MLLPVEELKAWQRVRGLGEVHLLSIEAGGFTLAHTDEERAASEAAGPPLMDCPLHQWLTSLGEPPVGPGLYIATRTPHDPVSDSFRGDACEWDFQPMNPA